MTSVDMMISILHKILSTGTAAAKADTEEVLSVVPEGSKPCMVNRIKGMGRPHRRAMTSIPPLQRTLVRLHSSTRHLVETALLLEGWVIMDALGRRNHRRTLSNFPALWLATMVARLTCLGVLSPIIRGKIRELAPTLAIRAATTRSAILGIQPK